MTENSSDNRPQSARRLALALIALTILFCCVSAFGAYRFTSLFEKEKAAQNVLQEKLQAVMLIQSSVLDLQTYVLDGDTRARDRLSDKTGQLEVLMHNNSSDKDYQQMYEAFHMWRQMLAVPMIGKRQEFDTSSLNFSEMGIAYIQANAPMHQRRIEELGAQALKASKDNLDAIHGEIAGALFPLLLLTASTGITALIIAFLLMRSL